MDSTRTRSSPRMGPALVARGVSPEKRIRFESDAPDGAVLGLWALLLAQPNAVYATKPERPAYAERHRKIDVAQFRQNPHISAALPTLRTDLERPHDKNLLACTTSPHRRLDAAVLVDSTQPALGHGRNDLLGRTMAMGLP